MAVVLRQSVSADWNHLAYLHARRADLGRGRFHEAAGKARNPSSPQAASGPSAASGSRVVLMSWCGGLTHPTPVARTSSPEALRCFGGSTARPSSVHQHRRYLPMRSSHLSSLPLPFRATAKQKYALRNLGTDCRSFFQTVHRPSNVQVKRLIPCRLSCLCSAKHLTEAESFSVSAQRHKNPLQDACWYCPRRSHHHRRMPRSPPSSRLQGAG